MAHGSRAAVFFGSLLLAVAARADTIAPYELLDRMNEAVRLLDYEGRFVVQSADRLDAMYIVHRVIQGVENERVVSLTGKPREIIRSDQAVACRLAGNDVSINVGLRSNGRSFSPLRGVSGKQLDASYHIEMLEPARVAGRDSYQMLIRPRDDLRYGYRLFIDRASALPLHSVMFDESQRPVSQMMFVELRVDRAITPIEHDLSAMQLARADPDDDLPVERFAPPGWTFPELPPGFHLNVHRRKALGKASGEREHFIFSDGLASVSVYVQPAGEGAGLSGVSRLGSAKAVGRILGEHEVIVVGEVPTKTLHWFAQQIQASVR
jgi:sigma-E factor negative regulatory protein RseB